MDRDFRTFERIVNEQAKIIKSGNAVRALVLARTLIIRTPEIMQDPIYIRFACSPLAAFLLTYPLVGFDEWYTR
jgi:hypothetical protein